jgi:hypothetical protein
MTHHSPPKTVSKSSSSARLRRRSAPMVQNWPHRRRTATDNSQQIERLHRRGRNRAIMHTATQHEINLQTSAKQWPDKIFYPTNRSTHP